MSLKLNRFILHPEKSEMLAIPVTSLLANSETDFDLYIEIQGELILYAKAPYFWLQEEIERLVGQGHKFFYYFNTESGKVEAYRIVNLTQRVDPSAAPNTRLNNITDAASELTRILFSHALNGSAMRKAEEIAGHLVQCLLEDKYSVRALGNLAHHDQYTFYHSARVAAYAIAVAIQESLSDEKQLKDLALGCLLHDIGKSRIDLEVLNKPDRLTPEEWELIKKHPTFGDEIVANTNLSVVPRSIITHHHERLDGSGYPHNLSANELLTEVKIASFADIFDALTTDRPYQKGMDRYAALMHIKSNLLEVVSNDAYLAMIALLGESFKAK